MQMLLVCVSGIREEIKRMKRLVKECSNTFTKKINSFMENCVLVSFLLAHSSRVLSIKVHLSRLQELEAVEHIRHAKSGTEKNECMLHLSPPSLGCESDKGSTPVKTDLPTSMNLI